MDISHLQQKPKKLRQKKSQVNFTSTADLRYEQDAKKLRVENSELSKKVANLDKQVMERTKCVEELSEQKAELLLRLRAMETKLSGYEVTDITSQLEKTDPNPSIPGQNHEPSRQTQKQGRFNCN